jgi:hypothetical protein
MPKSTQMNHFDLESRSRSTKSFSAKKHGPRNISAKLHYNLVISSFGISLTRSYLYLYTPATAALAAAFDFATVINTYISHISCVAVNLTS